MSTARTGVVVMAYGTPASPADVEAYYTHIRRGRPPSAAQLADLRERYAAIGGSSPLLELTRAQAAGLQRQLGDAYAVELGMKHAPPFIEDGVAALKAAGAERPVGLVLTPLYSRVSVGEYAARAVGVDVIEQWWDAPGYVELLADAVRRGLEPLPAGSEVVFTAHSLPARVVAAGDPYADQLDALAGAVAARAGLTAWSTGWQSAGRTADTWLGPDILDVLDDRAAAGAAGVLVCPCGFVSDHLEILYDLDVAARARARDLALPFARTAMPNADPRFLDVLARVVRARAHPQPQPHRLSRAE
jgi:ferrochelatase